MDQLKPPPPLVSEATKTADQRAEDVAYTINHALACTATDFIDPYFGNLTQRWLGKRYSVGCSHDHSHDHHHDHHHHDHHHAHHGSHLKQWWLGEVVGDFGAVPVTLAFQRGLPGFMDRLRGVMEPLLGPFFRNGARRSARRWAAENNVSQDSPEFAQRVEMIYRHEVDHLPQALMWTASSIAINLTTQRLTGNRGPMWQLAAGKAAGASISAALVVGARGLAPQAARNWDRFTSQNLFLPATRAIGGLAGIDDAAVDRMVERENELKGDWRERVAREERTGEATKTPE